MEISIDRKGKWVLLSLVGRLDGFNYELVAERLKTLVRAGKCWIAMDMTRVDYMSLGTVNLLKTVSEGLVAKGGKLLLLNLREEIGELLRTFVSEALIEFSDSRSLLEAEK